MAAYVASSDSDLAALEADDLQLTPASPPGTGAAAAAAAVGGGEDPDWVTSFTPTKVRPASTRRRPRGISVDASAVDGGGVALYDDDSADDDDDDDSILDLLGDEDGDDDLEGSGKGAGDNGKGVDGGLGEEDEEGNEGEDRIAGGASDADASRGRSGKALNGVAKSAVRSSMPLVAAAKLDENLILTQAGSSGLDLSGDVGAVGRVKVDESGVSLDMKGALYTCDVVDTNTVCVVAVGEDEARVTAVFDQVLALTEDTVAFGGNEMLISGVLEEDAVEVDSGLPKAGGAEKAKAKTTTGRPAKAKTKAKAKGAGKAKKVVVKKPRKVPMKKAPKKTK